MKRFFVVFTLLLALLIVAAGFFGVVRYGGIGSLILRARVAWAEWRPEPHPAAVPTPLPTPEMPRLATSAPRPTSTVAVSLLATPAPISTPTPPGSAPLQTTATPLAPTATPALTPIRPAVALTGFSHNWQTWNNCGPATLAMHLSYFEDGPDQETIRRALRPNSDDKNTGPDELAAFARGQGLRALVRVNGDADRLRQFISNGIPVLVETWIEPKPDDGMGHYRVLTGYDDARQVWIAYDSFISKGVRANEAYHGIEIPYNTLAQAWFVFNDTYLIIFDNAQSKQVQAILNDDWEQQSMWDRALSDALARTIVSPDDAFAWFNLGTDLTALARYEEAAAAYDQARQLGLPWRMLWYQFGPFAAYYQVGRYQEVLALADATLATTKDVEELHYWRAWALLALGDEAGAREALAIAIKLNPNYTDADHLLAEIDSP